MDLLRAATDNEMAIVGCLTALLGSAGLMFLSGAIFRRRALARNEEGATRVRGQVATPVASEARDSQAA